MPLLLKLPLRDLADPEEVKEMARQVDQQETKRKIIRSSMSVAESPEMVRATLLG